MPLLSYFVLMILKCLHWDRESSQWKDLEWTSGTRIMDPKHTSTVNLSPDKGRRGVGSGKGLSGVKLIASLHGEASVSSYTPVCAWCGNRRPCLPIHGSHRKIWCWQGMGRKCLTWPQSQEAIFILVWVEERIAQWAGISQPWIYLEIFKGRQDAWKLMQIIENYWQKSFGQI